MAEENIFKLLEYKSEALKKLVTTFVVCEKLRVEMLKIAGTDITNLFVIPKELSVILVQHLTECMREIRTAKLEDNKEEHAGILNSLDQMIRAIDKYADTPQEKETMLELIVYISAIEDYILRLNYSDK